MKHGCDQCQMLTINGIPCHETGCPNQGIGSIKECKWCGSKFTQESRYQRFCSDSCNDIYHGNFGNDEE